MVTSDDAAVKCTGSSFAKKVWCDVNANGPVPENARSWRRWFSFSDRSINIAFGLVGVAGVVLTIWMSFQPTPSPKLVCQIISEVSLGDFRKQDPRLMLEFDGKKVSSEQDLRFISLRVSNVGNAPVRTGDFDGNAIFGLLVEGAEVVSARSTESRVHIGGGRLSVEVLRGESEPKSSATKVGGLDLSAFDVEPDSAGRATLIRIAPFVLDRGDHFDVQLALKHEGRKGPRLAAVGGVAGGGRFEMRPTDSPLESWASTSRTMFLVAIGSNGLIILALAGYLWWSRSNYVMRRDYRRSVETAIVEGLQALQALSNREQATGQKRRRRRKTESAPSDEPPKPAEDD